MSVSTPFSLALPCHTIEILPPLLEIPDTPMPVQMREISEVHVCDEHDLGVCGGPRSRSLYLERRSRSARAPLTGRDVNVILLFGRTIPSAEIDYVIKSLVLIDQYRTGHDVDVDVDPLQKRRLPKRRPWKSGSRRFRFRRGRRRCYRDWAGEN